MLYCTVKYGLIMTMHATVAANSAPDNAAVSDAESY